MHGANRIVLLLVLTTTVMPAACREPVDEPTAVELTAEQQLGELLFFDTELSTPPGIACANCHDPLFAFADPDQELPVSVGSRPGHFGNRNDQPAAYAMFVPPLHRDPEEDIWVGGLFWDGRANTLEEQAQGPPLNPVEMANPDTVSILTKLRAAPYAGRFEAVYGAGALADEQVAYEHFARAVAAFERSPAFNRFDAKYDYFLRGEVELTDAERRGLELFEREDKGNCAACHPSQPEADGSPPMFTDFTYDNLGAPRNPANPHYWLPPEINPDGFAWVDLGLGLTVDDPAENGKFRVPTLRNVAVTAPYLHNGVFQTLFEVTQFYNTRDVAPWPPPEVDNAVNRDELGDLGLTTDEVRDIVAFMKTLTDGYEFED